MTTRINETDSDKKIRKNIKRYHTDVLSALLDPSKEYACGSQIAKDCDNYTNRGCYISALNDFVEAGEVFKDENGVYRTFVDKNNKFVHAFWRISKKNPTLLLDQIRAINKDKHVRSFYKAAINSEVADILRDCKLTPADLPSSKRKEK